MDILIHWIMPSDLPEVLLLDPTLTLESLRAFLHAQLTLGYVAIKDDVVVGFALLTSGDETVEINRLVGDHAIKNVLVAKIEGRLRGRQLVYVVE